MKRHSSNYKKLLLIIVKIIFATIISLSGFSTFWATDSDYGNKDYLYHHTKEFESIVELLHLLW